MWLLFYALIGAAGGLLIGLLGTGSSLIMLPALVLVFPFLFPEYDALRLAIGTTVASMTIGAIAAAATHWRQENIDFGLFKLMLFPYIAGALAGPWINRWLPRDYLRVYLTVVIVLLAVQMLVSNRNKTQAQKAVSSNKLQIRVVSLFVGLSSSMAGIASGMFMIPYLQRFKLSMLRIIGTSTAGAAVYCVAGLTGYVSAGWSSSDLPPGAVGFVYLPAFLSISIMLAISVPLGVRIAGHVDDARLRRLFAFFLILAAVAISANR